MKRKDDWIEELFIKEVILRNNKIKTKVEKIKQTNLRSIYYKKECPIKNTV